MRGRSVHWRAADALVVRLSDEAGPRASFEEINQRLGRSFVHRLAFLGTADTPSLAVQSETHASGVASKLLVSENV
jgi:hypothetical protein